MLTPDERTEWRRAAALGPSHGVNVNSHILLDLLDAADERDRVAERIRALHNDAGEGFCRTCDYGTKHPCPTLCALDGPPA